MTDLASRAAEGNAPPPRSGLEDLTFDNRFVEELPADLERLGGPRQVTGAVFSWVEPESVAAPSLVAFSQEVADDLGLTAEDCLTREFAEVFSGNRLLPGMKPWATCYGGHQFGNWAGQLGDGRAINLGEVVRPEGRLTLQLKGAGPTPYSRTADGRAVLRSSVREFLCSEAMHHLGIPTTRALSLTLTGDSVVRDMFYDGNPIAERGAIVCRVSSSFTRFGHFELPAVRGELDVLRGLVDYTIRHDYPHLGEPSKQVYQRWFEEVCERTAEMIVHWSRVGFVHGVMNTDNMSILGQTIDYGPYGWIEDYDPDWTPNTTDASGRRYRFGNQSQVALWNLSRLAHAIYPLVEEEEPFRAAFESYQSTHQKLWNRMMVSKLGLRDFEDGDAELIAECLGILSLVETDMTIFFRRLAQVPLASVEPDLPTGVSSDALLDAYYVPEQRSLDYEERFEQWLRSYAQRLRRDGRSDLERQTAMDRVNPNYVLRNYLAQLAIDRADEGDFTPVRDLLEVLRKPYERQEGREDFEGRRPEWARHRPGCSMLSCSS